ncbi:phosphotransferase family protein (plasmid) [Haloferacaceae archaeon DSL9]
MKREIRERLRAQSTTHEIVGRIHDVPPHEVYEVYLDGRRAVYKHDVGPTGNAGIEGRVLAFVGEQTAVPVPEIVTVGDDYYVAAWHPNAPSPDGNPRADDEWARAAGRGVATLHESTSKRIERYGRFNRRGDGRIGAGCEEWHAAATEYVRRHRPALARYGHGDIADAVLEFLDTRPNAFVGAGEPVCCHGWATPEHVSVVDGEVACVVDFEHAIAAPGEFDYWRTVLPTFGSSTGAEDAFREGYESVRSLPSGFARRRPLYVLLNVVYYFESLYVQAQHDPKETAERAERFRTTATEILDDED